MLTGVSARLLERSIREAETAATIGELLALEARAAGAYWTAWAGTQIEFAGRDRKRIPKRWQAFEARASPLTGSPRLAADPANAIANYLASLIEGEATIALHTVGLDPSLGIFHADRQGRQSFALDVMEPTRPHGDAYLLALLHSRVFRAQNFDEQDDGSVRLATPLARELAGTLPAWRDRVAPVVEHVAGLLAEDLSLPTPLTGAARRAAWQARKPDRVTRVRADSFPRLPLTCRTCGDALPNTHTRYCPRCRRQRFLEGADRARARAAQTLAALRTDQRDPAHGGRAAELRGAKNATHQAAIRTWDGDEVKPLTADELATLRRATIGQLVDLTGLSPAYLSRIRLGKTTPHGRWVEVLRRIAQGV